MYMSYNDPYKDFLRQTTQQGQQQVLQPQYQSQPYQMPTQPQAPQTSALQLVKVKGATGAEYYGRQLPPNTQTVCFDESQMLAYFVVTDGGSYPTVSAYELIPYEEKQPVEIASGDFITRNEFEEFKTAIISNLPKPKATPKAKEVATNE